MECGVIAFFLKSFLNYERKLERYKALKKGEFLGSLAWRLGLRKDVVLRNLKIAFPEKDENWRKETGKKAYMHLGRVVMEFGRLPDYLCNKKIGDFIVIEKGEELIEECREGGGVLVTGHIGNWEMMAPALASRGYKLSALAYKQKNEKVNNILDDLRTSCCINIVYHRDSVKPLVYALKNNEFAVFLVDQNTVKERGIFVDFFGKKALTVDFPARLAVKFEKPVLFFYNHFDEEKKIYRMYFEKVEWDRGSCEEESIKNLVQEYTKRVEKAIKECPYQYLWGHKRWKTRPDGEEPIY